MDNEPPGDIPIPPLDVDLSRMPGEIWDGDKQCKTHYGENHWQCPHLRVSVFDILIGSKTRYAKGKERTKNIKKGVDSFTKMMHTRLK